MTTASDLYKQGDLTGAIQALNDQVRSNPSSAETRGFLAELLCAKGDFDKADAQLTTILSLDAQTAITVGTWRQLVRAAQLREDVYNSGAIPDVIEQPTERIKNALSLLVALRAEDTDALVELKNTVDQGVENNLFNINGLTSVVMRDLDDVHAGIMEVMATNGKYFWVDFEQIVSLEIHQPTRPLEILWRKATIVLTNGTEGEVYIPSVYPKSSTDAMRLSRETDWTELSGVNIGYGLKTWLVGDDALSIDEIAHLESVKSLESVEV